MDDALLVRAREGDREAMEQILASVAPSIRRFAAGMCKNDADADDVLQDALLAIATHLDSFEGRSAFATWAFTLARSACARRRRGLKNRPAEPEEALASKASDTVDPEDQAASGEIGDLVTRALEKLSDEHREVLLLRDAEGLTAPEAAAVLGTSVDAVKSRLHRARAALREALAPVLERGAPRSAPDCPDVIAALSRKMEDELDAQACAQMEKHVAACPACSRTCDTLKSALRACRSAPGEVPEDVKAQVKDAVSSWLDRRPANAPRL